MHQHPLEHLSMETIEYIGGRLGLDTEAKSYDARMEGIFSSVRRRMGTDALRMAVAEVLA